MHTTFKERCSHDKLLLCLDFDGVLHEYHDGWRDGKIYDPPVKGAKEAVEQYLEKFDVVVYSARARTYEGRIEMEHWLAENNFPALPITCEKPPAFLTIDDRALTFTGSFPDVHELAGFKTWNEGRV